MTCKPLSLHAGVLAVAACLAAGVAVAGDLSEEATLKRIAPVARVELATPVQETAGAPDGKKTYQGLCAACHATGAAGAPKAGSKDDWAPRLAKGVDSLYNNALNGLNGMPAKGGNPSLSDEEVKAAVDFMTEGVR